MPKIKKKDASTTENTVRLEKGTIKEFPNLRPFAPGVSGNPKGKPKGSRHKLGEAFIEAMHEDFQEYGSAVIEEVRKDKPEQYLKVVASILPKEINVNTNAMEELSDDDLDALQGLLEVAKSQFASAAPKARRSRKETATRH